MKFAPFYTKNLRSPYEGLNFISRHGVLVPSSWSAAASEIFATRYCRRIDPQETDARHVFHRLAGCWTDWGKRNNYFSTPRDAEVFYNEICYMLAHQIASPNSPQWFNTGLHFAYGLTGSPQGHYYVDPRNGKLCESTSAYERSQVHACFIQGINDTLVNSGGIMDLWVREARLFKYGSGTGTNFSRLRAEGEPLSGGGTSSGMLSFLKVGDRAAGAVKSGGTTRRAAKMVLLDVDHPEIEAFIEWKVLEEYKVRCLVEGSKKLVGPKFDYDWQGEAYQTVSGQNSNNSVRVTDAFLQAVQKDEAWPLRRRSDGKTVREVSAQLIWKKLARAAWECADPGVQFDTTINSWHTCPESGRIEASNPCSEYLFLNDTACNLASLNLAKFGDFDTAAFRHACRLWTVVLEISVVMAQFPSPEVAENSHAFRTLGLGFANLGGFLMAKGIAYDSEEGRSWAAGVTALMGAEAYAVSAEMAAELGYFIQYPRNAESMGKVIARHREAAEKLATPIGSEALRRWREAEELGKAHGYRNAQVTCIAPTGTIGLLMDCDTLGIEPDFALVKDKELAGGGRLKLINQSVARGLRKLGYEKQMEEFAKTGRLTGLRAEHAAVFASANEISAAGHIDMMAAVQPFVSGGISKTLNLPAVTTPDEIESVYFQAWKKGLKSMAVYRDGSKLSQPLVSSCGMDSECE